MSDDILLEQTPEYLNAVAAHSIAAGDETPLFGGLGGMTAGALAGARIGALAGGIPGAIAGAAIGGITGYDYRLAATAAISGAVQVGNSISNIATLGADESQVDIGDTIQWFDDDLGRYYEGHKESVDTLGFVAASFPVGLGGVKLAGNVAASVLKSYNAGKVGRTGAVTLGIFKDKKAELISEAVQKIKDTGSFTSMMDKSVLGAIAAGAGEAAVQGMVFEGMVQAGLNASPLLEDQTLQGASWDTLKTGLISAGLGAGLETLLTKYTLAKNFREYEKVRYGHIAQESTIAGAPTDVQYILNNISKDYINDHVRYAQTYGIGTGRDSTQESKVLIKASEDSIYDLRSEEHTSELQSH